MSGFPAVEASRDLDITIEPVLLTRTILSEAPTVVLVLRSVQGSEYLGHLELSPESAEQMGEAIRIAAKAAETTLEES